METFIRLTARAQNTQLATNIYHDSTKTTTAFDQSMQTTFNVGGVDKHAAQKNNGAPSYQSRKTWSCPPKPLKIINKRVPYSQSRKTLRQTWNNRTNKRVPYSQSRKTLRQTWNNLKQTGVIPAKQKDFTSNLEQPQTNGCNTHKAGRFDTKPGNKKHLISPTKTLPGGVGTIEEKSEPANRPILQTPGQKPGILKETKLKSSPAQKTPKNYKRAHVSTGIESVDRHQRGHTPQMPQISPTLLSQSLLSCCSTLPSNPSLHCTTRS